MMIYEKNRNTEVRKDGRGGFSGYPPAKWVLEEDEMDL